MDRLDEAVAEVIRGHRARLGISQESLSVKAGVHRTFISKIEKSSRNPTIESVFRLSMALGMEPEDLVREIKEKARQLGGCE
jgi:transcriptional regulator with XRE-family HTH domain